MAKTEKNKNLHLRISAKQRDELEELIERWNQVTQGTLLKSEVTRNALDEYIRHYNIDSLWHDGNVFYSHFNQDNYKVVDLFDLAAELQEAYQNEKNESKAYLLKQLFNLVSRVYSYEIEVYQFNGAHYTTTHKMSINKRNTKEG